MAAASSCSALASASNDLIRRMLVASLLQAQVVVGADAGQHRELLAAQAGNLPPAARDQPDVLRPEQVAPCPQVVTQCIGLVHGPEAIRPRRAVSGPAAPRISGTYPGDLRPAKTRDRKDSEERIDNGGLVTISLITGGNKASAGKPPGVSSDSATRSTWAPATPAAAGAPPVNSGPGGGNRRHCPAGCHRPGRTHRHVPEPHRARAPAIAAAITARGGFRGRGARLSMRPGRPPHRLAVAHRLGCVSRPWWRPASGGPGHPRSAARRSPRVRRGGWPTAPGMVRGLPPRQRRCDSAGEKVRLDR